jgi:hypothetical protein
LVSQTRPRAGPDALSISYKAHPDLLVVNKKLSFSETAKFYGRCEFRVYDLQSTFHSSGCIP